MDDMKIVEALNDLRAELRKDNAELRREVRQDLRDVRQQAVEAYLAVTRKLVWAIIVLGLALGGKDLLQAAL